MADHLEVLATAIAQIPPQHRRRIVITCDGAGATIELLAFITALSTRSRQAPYSVGFGLDERARIAITALPADGWPWVLDEASPARDPQEAGTTELTGLLRHSAGAVRLVAPEPPYHLRRGVPLRRSCSPSSRLQRCQSAAEHPHV
ncbi:hypothetical protein [Nonomuraea sp. NPDC050202]|uniref:hypothetical protein n=1 Tax=Nonomuraea sp. NPDC050202 TaxID=3155035 RepID=UPI00340BEDEC